MLRDRIAIGEIAVIGLAWIHALIALIVSSSDSTTGEASVGADDGPDDLEHPAERSANTVNANKTETNFVLHIIFIFHVLYITT